MLARVRAILFDKITAAIALVLAGGILVFAGGFLPDMGDMRFTPPTRVVVGDTVTIDPVIDPRWWTLKRGRFVISSISTNLEPGRRESAFDITPVKTPVRLSALLDTPLVYKPVREGLAEIRAELRSGKEGDDRSLCDGRWTFNVERHHPYDGRWAATLADQKGELILHESPDDPEGVYGVAILGGTQGLIRGHFDGTQLNADLTLGNAAVRWTITASTSKDGDVLQAKGDAVAYSVQNGFWAPMENTGARPFSIRKSIER